MEKLRLQCQNAETFPLNLNDIPSWAGEAFKSQSLHSKLDEHQSRLFCDDRKALINVLEYGFGRKDWWPKFFNNTEKLREYLGLRDVQCKRDPWSRFIFIDAPNSRAALNVTREMLTLVFSYQQIQPGFIDFLIPFGKQNPAQDFHFTSFRQRTRLSTGTLSPSIPELGWSGRDFQLCYNLKSVEPSSSQDRPWSIRHCAVNHTFDVENARTSWILIKGNDLIQQRMTQATNVKGLPKLRDIALVDRAFAASLVVHSILCDWSAEGWRWYVNYLEEKIKPIESRAMNYEIDAPPENDIGSVGLFPTPSRTQTNATETSRFSRFSRATRRLSSDTKATIRESTILRFSRRNTSRSCDIERQQPENLSLKINETEDSDEAKYDQYGQLRFSFRDLQELHFIDAQVSEAGLVIQHNLHILQQLIFYYAFLFKLKDFPKEISQKCEEEMSHFNMHISGVEMDLKMQASRLRALQHSTTHCQNLLHNILDFHNTQSNKLLARESRSSTKNMESMSGEMNEIARKTKTETVSMKIITLVTLFFLPGTFISTLMSTDIFQDEDARHSGPNPYNHMTPLQVYLAASLPLTAITLAVWGIFHWIERNKERMDKFKAIAERTAHQAGRVFEKQG